MTAPPSVKDPVILTTPRLILRPLGVRDLETTHAYASDAENTRYTPYLPNETAEETEAYLQGVEADWQRSTPDDYEFAILARGEHIGAVSFGVNAERTECHFGWILNKAYWHRGYATEAAARVIAFARDKVGIRRVTARCDGRNTASIRVMERLGMKLCDDQGVRVYPRRGETAQELTYALTFD